MRLLKILAFLGVSGVALYVGCSILLKICRHFNAFSETIGIITLIIGALWVIQKITGWRIFYDLFN